MEPSHSRPLRFVQDALIWFRGPTDRKRDTYVMRPSLCLFAYALPRVKLCIDSSRNPFLGCVMRNSILSREFSENWLNAQITIHFVSIVYEIKNPSIIRNTLSCKDYLYFYLLSLFARFRLGRKRFTIRKLVITKTERSSMRETQVEEFSYSCFCE